MEGAVAVKELRELTRAFEKFDHDLTTDMADELAEACDPVRKTATGYIISGGGGFPAMRGIAQGRDSAYWSGMRIGVSRSLGQAYVAPAWSSNKGTLQGKVLAVQFRFRMEAALEDEAGKVVEKLDGWLGTLEHAWGSQFAV